jgi:hypothetical protein
MTLVVNIHLDRHEVFTHCDCPSRGSLRVRDHVISQFTNELNRSIGPPELMSHTRLDNHCSILLSDVSHDSICLYTSGPLCYTEDFCMGLMPMQPCRLLTAREERNGDFWA